jgi:hypothetical protein
VLYDYVGWIRLCQEARWFDVFFRGPHPAGVRVRAAAEKIIQTAFHWFSGVTHAQAKKTSRETPGRSHSNQLKRLHAAR